MSELIKRGQEIVMAAPQLYIDIDVEADGKAGYGSLLSIGAVTPDGETYYMELKPSQNQYIASQRQFCEEHGLQRTRLLQEGAKPKTAMQDFANWTDYQAKNKGKKPVFAAFNAGFDFALIDLEFARSGIKNPYGIAPFCLKSLAQAVNQNWDWNETSKNRLPAAVLPEGDFTHNALEDAIYQQHIHFGLAAMLEELHDQRSEKLAE
jgi:hypothetical protein